jgi:hypothetical protein
MPEKESLGIKDEEKAVAARTTAYFLRAELI